MEKDLDQKKIKEILASFIRKKVVVIGDFYLDEYIYTESDKLSPEASVPRAVIKSTEHVPGAAANVANVIRALGAQVSAVGVIGADHTGDILCNLMQSKGISISGLVRDNSRITGTLSRVLLKSPGNKFHHVIRLDNENFKEISEKTKQDILSRLKDELKTADAVFVADYDEIGTGLIKEDVLKSIVIEAKSKEALLIGISRGHISNLKDFDILVGNKTEVEMASGKDITDDQDLIDAVNLLRKDLNNKTFIATRSEKGLIAASDDVVKLPTFADNVVDVCGAGDCLTSAFTLATLSDAGLKDACIIGNAAAAAAVAKAGTATVSIEEIEDVLFNEGKSSTKLENLLEIIQKAKLQGKKIVMANGYFDFVHGGHISFLKAAKKLGDILIVAINSDGSTKLNKGADHPLIGEEERAKIISSFGFVDYVIIFNELTPIKIIKAIQPDVLVKGGNFTESQVVGADLVSSIGGKVAIIPLQGPTTTSIIEHIRNSKKAIHD